MSINNFDSQMNHNNNNTKNRNLKTYITDCNNFDYKNHTHNSSERGSNNKNVDFQRIVNNNNADEFMPFTKEISTKLHKVNNLSQEITNPHNNTNSSHFNFIPQDTQQTPKIGHIPTSNSNNYLIKPSINNINYINQNSHNKTERQNNSIYNNHSTHLNAKAPTLFKKDPSDKNIYHHQHHLTLQSHPTTAESSPKFEDNYMIDYNENKGNSFRKPNASKQKTNLREQR